jgi:hypothetical protein
MESVDHGDDRMGLASRSVDLGSVCQNCSRTDTAAAAATAQQRQRESLCRFLVYP